MCFCFNYFFLEYEINFLVVKIWLHCFLNNILVFLAKVIKRSIQYSQIICLTELQKIVHVWQ